MGDDGIDTVIFHIDMGCLVTLALPPSGVVPRAALIPFLLPGLLQLAVNQPEIRAWLTLLARS